MMHTAVVWERKDYQGLENSKATTENVMKGIFWATMASAMWGISGQSYSLFHRVKIFQPVGSCQRGPWALESCY